MQLQTAPPDRVLRPLPIIGGAVEKTHHNFRSGADFEHCYHCCRGEAQVRISAKSKNCGREWHRGCSLYLFGQVRTELNRASNWMRFPRSSPAPGTVAVRNHHVMVLVSQVDGSNWIVHDGNSGGGLTRDHVASIRGYTIVNPRGG
jgi:hypothetical protein